MDVKYIEKIIVLVNNNWKYDTYIMDSDITENKVKEFILSKDKQFKIDKIKYEFHGGPPMGTVMFNYKEIKGENVWVVNLKPDINYILKGNNDFENMYIQNGGNLNDIISSKFDGTNYYNYIIIFRDDKFLEKIKIISKNELTNKLLINRLKYINNNKSYYGNMDELIESENGIILKTSKNKFKVFY